MMILVASIQTNFSYQKNCKAFYEPEAISPPQPFGYWEEIVSQLIFELHFIVCETQLACS